MSSLPVDQHMARVNLSEEQWLEFRALAIREKKIGMTLERTVVHGSGPKVIYAIGRS